MSSALENDLQRFLLLVPQVARQPEGVPLDEICAQLALGVPELHRLLERVVAIGAPDGSPDELVDIYIDADRLHVALPQGFTRPPRFSLEEALSLAMVLQPLREAPLPELAREAEALSQTLSTLTSQRAEHPANDLRQRLVVQGEGLEKPDHLRDLETAVREHRLVEMEYYTAYRDTMSSRELRPLGMFEDRGAWYVLGHDRRTFRVSRIRSLSLSSEHFEAPPDFDLATFRTSTRGPEVELTFIEKTPDHGEDREHKFPSSVHYARTYLLSHRGRVELRGPANARAEVLNEIRELAQKYC